MSNPTFWENEKILSICLSAAEVVQSVLTKRLNIRVLDFSAFLSHFVDLVMRQCFVDLVMRQCFVDLVKRRCNCFEYTGHQCHACIIRGLVGLRFYIMAFFLLEINVFHMGRAQLQTKILMNA